MFEDSRAYVVDVLLIGWKLRKDGAPTSIASHVDSISVSDRTMRFLLATAAWTAHLPGSAHKSAERRI